MKENIAEIVADRIYELRLICSKQEDANLVLYLLEMAQLEVSSILANHDNKREHKATIIEFQN